MQNTTHDLISLTKKQFDELVSVFPLLHSLEQKLDGVVAPHIVKDIKQVYKIISNVCEEEINKQEAIEDKNDAQLSELAEENHFSSVWSVETVQAKDMNSLCPHRIKKITYESFGKPQSIKITQTNLTWLDIWKICDELMSKSGDTHHIFIEDLIEDKKGVFSLSTGS